MTFIVDHDFFRLGLGGCIEKFKEQGVLEPEFFYKLNQVLVKGLGIESFGLTKILMKEIENFNKKEQEFEEEREEICVDKIRRTLQKTKSIQY